MNRLRKQLFLAVSLAALMLLGPVLPLSAQTTVITAGGGGAATSVSAAAFPLLGPADSSSAPNYSFAADPDIGVFRVAANILGFASGGAANHFAGVFGTTGLTSAANAFFSWSSTSNAITGTPDTGLRRVVAGVVGSTLGASGDGWLQNQAGDQFLTADHANATATPTNLTDLTTNVTTGRKYTCTLTLQCSQSVAADGVRVDFEGGTATATNFSMNVTILDAAAYDTHTRVTALATDVTSTDVGTTVLIQAVGSFEPSSTGTFIPRIGLEAASTGTITTFRGSSLTCKDMP